MRKRLIRITALFLAVAMLSLFNACGQQASPSAPSASAAPASSAPASSAPASSAPSQAGKLPPLEISFVSPNWENAPDFNNEWWTRFFEETNTKWTVNFIPSNDYPTKYDLILASGDLPDIIMSEDSNRPTTVQAVRNGAFWNLSPFLGDFSKYPNLGKNPTPNAFKYASYNGDIYAIPRSRPQIDEGIAIRKDWLDKLGIPEPTTLEEYRDALKKIVDSDPDGNGQNDTIGLVGWLFEIKDAAKSFRNAFGVFGTEPDANGGLVHPYLKDEQADFVEYYKSLYDLGLISKEWSVMKNTQAEDIIVSGRAASYGYNIWRNYDYEVKTRKVQPDAVWETLLPMKGPKGNTARLEKGVYGYFHISKKVPEDKLLRILDYFEYCCTEDMTMKAYYGWEGVHYTLDSSGSRVMTELGKTQIGTGVQQPLPMIANTWAKVVCVTAPKDYNDAKLKRVQVYLEQGNIDPFECFASDSWTNAWPKVESEYQENFVKTVAGQMSVDDFRAYLAKLRDMPEFKQAFQDFAKMNQDLFGK